MFDTSYVSSIEIILYHADLAGPTVPEDLRDLLQEIMEHDEDPNHEGNFLRRYQIAANTELFNLITEIRNMQHQIMEILGIGARVSRPVQFSNLK